MIAIILAIWLAWPSPSPPISVRYRFDSAHDSGIAKHDGGMAIVYHGVRVWECDPAGRCGGIL